jgi:hypothetical protein
MTTDRPTTRSVGTRRRQDDLLDDLRATVPVPAPARTAPVPDTVPAAGPGTPAVEVRLTPLRWSLPRAAPVADPSGVLLSLGPLQLFVGRRAG